MSDKWDYKVFWDEAITRLRSKISEQEFTMWIKRLEYIESDEYLIKILVPSSFFGDQVSTRYLKDIEEILTELSGETIKIEFIIGKPSNAIKVVKEEEEASPILIKEIKNDAVELGVKEKVKSFNHHAQLNQDYTFDNFVIGDNNSFAANAAMVISREPGVTYNPFLIYGGVGLGKTHLIQSIGNHIHSKSPDKKIMYVQMESFTNEFIESVNTRKTHLFKSKYRNADVLLIDDIHFIQGKEGTQEELFYTFNALYDHKKQMVFTCDRPISEMKNITERLRSRFERGLNVDLQPPAYETRYAILMKKIESWGIHIPEESLKILCTNITTNVRDLEKALIKLRAYSELMGKDLTPETTLSQIKDFFTVSNGKNITIDLIIKEVAAYFNKSSQDLKNKRRNQSVSFPRQIAMYIARQITEYSTTEIGLEFGGRDHTTIMHGCQKITAMMKTDSTIEPTVNKLIRNIQNGGTNT